MPAKEIETREQSAVAGNMDKKTIIVLAVVGSLGLLSAILGFSGEGTKLTYAYHYGGMCYYPANPALGLGVCAAIFLVIAQVTIAVVGGCCGCCQSGATPSGNNRIIGIVCAVFSWITALIALGLLVTGVSASQTGWRDTIYGLCWVPMDGIFAGGAVLTLTATALGLSSYILLRRLPDAAVAAAPVANAAQASAPVSGAAVIAMGQPQFPQQTPQQGNGQTPQPIYGMFSPPPVQGYVAQASNQQFYPPAQGYEAHGLNHNQQDGQTLPPNYGKIPPLPAQGYVAQAPNQQFYPPAQGYEAHGSNHNQQNGQTPSPNYGKIPPLPAQGYVAQAPNKPFYPPAQGYEAHGSNHNQQVPPPSRGYGALAPKQQFPLPDPGYGASAPNMQHPPPSHVYAAQAPNTEFDPTTLINLGAGIHRVATSISDDGTFDESTSRDPAHYEASAPPENYFDPTRRPL